MTKSYWLENELITGDRTNPKPSDLLIVGSGISGVSTAYWLLKNGLENITLIDDLPEKSASVRNCGHVLNGSVESMHALTKLRGKEEAGRIWEYSVKCCEQVQSTVKDLGLTCEYEKTGYITIAIDEAEEAEILSSVELLNQINCPNKILSKKELEELGFQNISIGRYEENGARINPLKFRNGMLKWCLENGLKYHSGVVVEDVKQQADEVILSLKDGSSLRFPFVVLATNAYTPQISKSIESKSLVVPFRGQMIVSKPLKSTDITSTAHSFNHGYEYGLLGKDNRLLLGGWRDNVPGMEEGEYELTPNDFISKGLAEFAEKYYKSGSKIEWDYSWTGIMASSSSGLPYVGSLSSERIFVNFGFTGHGVPWGHGTGKLLANVICGLETDPILPLLRVPM